jgi:hypothetical protein
MYRTDRRVFARYNVERIIRSTSLRTLGVPEGVRADNPQQYLLAEQPKRHPDHDRS